MIGMLKGAAFALLIAAGPIFYGGYVKGAASEKSKTLDTVVEYQTRATRASLRHTKTIEDVRHKLKLARRQANARFKHIIEQNKALSDWWPTPVPDPDVVWNHAFRVRVDGREPVHRSPTDPED